MGKFASQGLSRRMLLSSSTAYIFVASTARAVTISGGLPWSPNSSRPPLPVRPGPWQFFSADEAACIEAVVDRLIPADELGAGGRHAGCAIFIDRQLAGAFGRGDGLYTRPPFMPGAATQGYQAPESPAMRYRAGLRALAAYVKGNFGGKAFQDLSTADQDKILSVMETGALALDGVDSARFFELLLQNTQEGFFADPVYGGNRDMMGWKMIGFPGARYDYRDWVERHNEPYPLPPVGIMGRSDWTTQE